MSNANTAPEFRIVLSTARDGITSVGSPVSRELAWWELRILREANPSWLRIAVERVEADGSSREVYATHGVHAC